MNNQKVYVVTWTSIDDEDQPISGIVGASLHEEIAKSILAEELANNRAHDEQYDGAGDPPHTHYEIVPKVMEGYG